MGCFCFCTVRWNRDHHRRGVHQLYKTQAWINLLSLNLNPAQFGACRAGLIAAIVAVDETDSFAVQVLARYGNCNNWPPNLTVLRMWMYPLWPLNQLRSLLNHTDSESAGVIYILPRSWQQVTNGTYEDLHAAQKGRRDTATVCTASLPTNLVRAMAERPLEQLSRKL